jgi:hypothetical protein
MTRTKKTCVVLGALVLLFLSGCDRGEPEQPPVPPPPQPQSVR